VPIISGGGGGGGTPFNGGTITTALACLNSDPVQTTLFVQPPIGTLADGTTVVSVVDENSLTVLAVSPPNAGSTATAVYVGGTGFLVMENHAAPVDGDLFAGDCSLWFDQTNGAAKLMVKAKQADGTVRTGSVNLA